MTNLETKEQRIEYGESAERWVVNKINSLNLPNWQAEVIYNREDNIRNHCEGDILLKYKLDEHQNVLIYIDIKSATEKYDYPVIRVNYHNGNMLLESKEYLSGVNHNFYLGIGKYDKSLENNTNVEFPYSLGITNKMINKMLDNDCEFIKANRKTMDGHNFFVSMKHFINENSKILMPVGTRKTLKEVLEVIEKYIQINKDKNIFKIELV